MIDPAERELIDRCRRGEERAFRELVEKYQRRTYWIAHSILHDYEAAQDVSQEAFIRVFRNLPRFDPQKKFYTWLYQIVVNLCIDRMRRRGRHAEAPLDQNAPVADERPNPEESFERQDLRAKVERTMKSLPDKYRAVLALRDIHGFSCEEIAEAVGCSNPTARWRLHRARILFKALWEGRRAPAIQDDEPDEAGEP